VPFVLVLSCGGASVPTGPGVVVDDHDASISLDGATISEAAFDREASRADDDGAGRVDAGSTDGRSAEDAAIEAPRVADAALDVSADAGREAGPDVSTGPEAGLDASLDAGADVNVNACPVDCNHLPNVLPGLNVPCVAGRCALPFGACVDGFAHCTANPNDGCESDLSRPQTCGSCFNVCSGFYPVCTNQGGVRACGPNCAPPYPDSCGFTCVDLATDFYNCGTCGTYCYLPNAETTCQRGACVVTQCSSGFADCTPDPGCETELGTADNCSRCGDRACSLAHTLLTCGGADNCATAVCEPGFANCDATSPDCETAFATGGTCLPTYLGTAPLATLVFGDDAAVLIGSDGSYFVAGRFTGTVDFDPTSGMDIRTTTDSGDAYITKFAADGSYAWTRTFTGRGDAHITQLAAATGGAVVAVGAYTDTIDLDPGAAVDLHQTVNTFNYDPLIVKLGADGSFVWGATLAGNSFGQSGSVVGVDTDASDAVYVATSFAGDIDVDPGPGMDVRSAVQSTGLLVKLSSAGALSWARTISNGDCSSALNAVTLASDGTAWVTGTFQSGCALGPPPVDGGIPASSSLDVLVAAFGSAGAPRGTWTFGGPTDDMASAIVAGTNGSIYVGGQAQGNVDFDPGPGVVTRSLFGGGFVLNLATDGSFRWVETIEQTGVGSLAATPDGGVLAVWAPSAGAIVTKLNANGTSAWTLASGVSGATAHSVAASATNFAIGGNHSGSSDFNPGAGIDIIFGDVTFLSRYSF